MIQYIKFGLKTSFGSRGRVQTSFLAFWSKFDIQSAGVTLKMRSKSPNFVSFSCHSGVSVQVWSKSSNWFRRYSAYKAHVYSIYKAHVYSLYSVVTLKMRSKSPKSNQFF